MEDLRLFRNEAGLLNKLSDGHIEEKLEWNTASPYNRRETLSRVA